MEKEKIKNKKFATNSVPMAVIFRSERVLAEVCIGLDRKIQILSLDSSIESGNGVIKKTSQKNLERFLRYLSAHSIKLNFEFGRIDSV